MEFLTQYLLIAVVFIVIDAVWLTLIANKFYKSQLGSLLKPKADLKPAVVFYLLYVVGMVVFALRPAIEAGSVGMAAGLGALLGLIMYATYDLTNYSTLKGWPFKVVAADLAWGTFVTAASVAVVYLIVG